MNQVDCPELLLHQAGEFASVAPHDAGSCMGSPHHLVLGRSVLINIFVFTMNSSLVTQTGFIIKALHQVQATEICFWTCCNEAPGLRSRRLVRVL